MEKLITHRCEGSLNAKMSIRFEDPFKPWGKYEKTWWLSKLDARNDWGVKYLRVIGKITYCPYCGVKLAELMEV